MLVTHGIALFFAVVFVVLAVVFRKMVWWGMSLGYVISLSWFGIINNWEMLFFIPLVCLGLISLIGMFISALAGDLI